jgi:hypothetical protein
MLCSFCGNKQYLEKISLELPGDEDKKLVLQLLHFNTKYHEAHSATRRDGTALESRSCMNINEREGIEEGNG